MDFDARWSPTLIAMSVLSSGVILVVSWQLWNEMGPELGALPLALLAGALLYTIRGYRVEGSALVIQRLVWGTRLELMDLKSAEIDPEAMASSLRIFGNGGLFAFAGWFQNKKLGRYRAWVTQPKDAVVLTFEGRTYVVSPYRPEAFVEHVRSVTGLW